MNQVSKKVFESYKERKTDKKNWLEDGNGKQMKNMRLKIRQGKIKLFSI